MSLKEQYQKEILPELKKELGVANIHSVPKVDKVVVNIGLGRASQQANFDKTLVEIEKELGIVTGQKPSRRPAKKSIAGFKLREGQTIGLKVTLRNKRMFDFIEKIIKIVLPRVRDFKGIDLKNIDKQGNLNLGFKEHVVFPEVSQENTAASFGIQATIVLGNSTNRDHAIALYRKLGFLFKQR